MATHGELSLIAVDIGNSRLKLGYFRQSAKQGAELPEPSATFDLPIEDRSGRFDANRLAAWCLDHVESRAHWLVASVHRGAAQLLATLVEQTALRTERDWPLKQLSFRDFDMPIRVDEPSRVGIDRLLAALAVDRLRRADRAAIVVDLGSAITVDRVDRDGAFAGGSILPGIAMSARALAEQTDALPRIELDLLDTPPIALGKSTTAAIEAGLYWGAVGAIRELVAQLAAGEVVAPEVWLTGGASARVADLLTLSADRGDLAAGDWSVRHVPHLVLSGIAIVGEAMASKS